MQTDEVYNSIFPLIKDYFFEDLKKYYWSPLYKYITENPHLKNIFPAFLLHPEKIIFYVGKTHIAVEYLGSEILTKDDISKVNFEIEVHDYSKKESNLFELIIGFEYDSTTGIDGFPLISVNEDFVFPTNRGYKKLSELGWNFLAQNSILAFNTPAPKPKEKEFSRIVNGLFFDANDSGLKTRHIKWLDFYPIDFDDSDEKVDTFSYNLSFLNSFVEYDAKYKYPLPYEYKLIQLPKINRFIELWGNSTTNEPTITSFLATKQNNFILTMKFGVIDIFSELTCVWQSEEKKDIRPDFFILHPNGYADIVEFKLPTINKSFIVGSDNRESFSSFLNSYISQTRVYSTYFDDPSNRIWFEEQYGFKVYKPRRWLVVGRRNDFDLEIWKEIVSDYNNIEIITYDDLIDGVIAQFYKD